MILFFEDDKMIADTIREFLNELGYQYQLIDSVNVAIDIVEDKKPDLIFFDLLLNGEYAFNTIKKIKKNSKTNHIPIIAMTALLDKSNIQKAKDSGVNQIISKPFKLAELTNIIEKYIDGPKP